MIMEPIQIDEIERRIRKIKTIANNVDRIEIITKDEIDVILNDASMN